MNSTKLDELLGKIFTNRRDVWKRKLRGWHNTEAYPSVHKIKAYLAVLSFGIYCFPDSIFHIVGTEPDKATTTAFHVNRPWKAFFCKMDRTHHKLSVGLKFALSAREPQPFFLAHFLLWDWNEQKYLLSHLTCCCSCVLHNNQVWFDLRLER